MNPTVSEDVQGNEDDAAGEATPVEDTPVESNQPSTANESRAEMVEKEDMAPSTEASNEAAAPVPNSQSSKPIGGSYDSKNMEKMEKDFAQLRKKYDELLKWTLQLTGDRDKLQKMTDKLTPRKYKTSGDN